MVLSGHCEMASPLIRAAYGAGQALAAPDIMAMALSQLAWCGFRLGDPETGLQCAMAARRLWARLGDAGEEAMATAIEAFLLLDLGQTDDAYRTADTATVRALMGGDAGVLGFALNAKAVAFCLSRQADLALPLLEQALGHAVDGADDCARAFSLINLGYCYAQLGDEAGTQNDEAVARHWHDLAIEATDEAVNAAAEGGDIWCMHTGLTNVAEFRVRRGEARQALACLLRAGRIQAHGGKSMRTHFLYTLAAVLRDIGRFDEAIAISRQAIALAEASGQVDHHLNAAAQLAAACEAGGDMSGAIEAHKLHHRLYVEQSGRIAARQARVAELRLENDRLRNETVRLTEQALTDPLTGLANRRGFDAKVAALAGTPFAAALLDLDHFKAVNDNFTHIIGDAVLRRIGTLLDRHMRPDGSAARLGGEEFVLLFPNHDLAAASARCEAIRAGIKAEDWSAIAEGLAVSVSIGVADRAEGDTPTDVFPIADNRLYAAKSLGRDRVVDRDLIRRRAAS